MTGTSRIAGIVRISAKIAAGLIAVVALIIVVLFIVNSFDVALSPQARALLTPPPNPCRAEENIYLAMAGMEGRGDRPIVELGLERIDAYNKALDSMPLNPEAGFALNKKWEDTKLKVAGSIEDLGHPRTGSIWIAVKAHRPEIAALLAANQLLYERYLSLHYLRGYYETARPSFMAPVINPPPSMHTIFLADVANRVQAGTSAQQRDALADLQRDLQMWRIMLKGDGTLISKMLSVAFLHGDMILLADLLTDPTFNSSPLADLLDPMLLPFDAKDYGIGSAFAAEFRGSAPVYKSITASNELLGTSASWPSRISNAFGAHFFKINATENMGAEIAARWVAVANSDPKEFEQNRQAARDWLDKEAPHLMPSYIYNPMGKVLANLSGTQYASYALRAYDVAAYQRLVYLVFQLKHQHIAAADITAFMTARPDWSTHPVDGKPFQWDSESSHLAVSTLGPNPKEQRFSVTLD